MKSDSLYNLFTIIHVKFFIYGYSNVIIFEIQQKSERKYDGTAHNRIIFQKNIHIDLIVTLI